MIVVVGEALIDLVPADAAEEVYRAEPGGGPFNTAVALGRLGVPTAFGGSLSTDGFGRRLRGRLAEAGVDLSLAAEVPAPTPLAVVTLGRDGGENLYSFHLVGTALEAFGPVLTEPLREVEALHVGTLGTTVDPLAAAVTSLVEREHERVLVGFDPNVRPLLVDDRERFRARVDHLAGLADVVKVSDADAAWLATGPEAALAERWLAAGAGVVVVTHGAEGAEAWTPAHHVAAPGWPAVVADTVGAGDAFNGGLFAWLHRTGRLTKDAVRALDPAALTDALRFASLVAARTCERPGADPPWHHDLPEEHR